MLRIVFPSCFRIAFALLLLTGSLLADRPDIVVILADDMGYSDLSCYGGEIATPALDRLARDGVRFTQFYNTARCCPSRAALLTGLYSHQAGVGHMTEEKKDREGHVLPGYSGRLNDRCVTLAEVLHGAGYFTAMAGKWHVGQEHGVTPWNRGFDRSLNSAAGGFYYPDSPRAELWLDGQNLHRRDAPLPPQWYTTDLFAEYGLRFIDEAHTAGKPFFLYLPFNAPHFPLQAPEEEIARHRGQYRAGWDALREARYRRQIELGLIDANWPLSPRLPEVPAWDSLTPEQQDRYDHIMAVYAAVLEHMDRAIGQVVAGLRERGLLENTLILFMSDNGGNAEAGTRGRLEGEHPGDAASTVFIGQAWATLSNTPFVRYKHYTDEGGIATPLIAHWPAWIPAERRGALERQPGHLIDILPTCLEAAGATYPAEFGGHPVQPVEGISLLPAVRGGGLQRPHPIFWEHEGNRAVRDGKWKLVALARQPWRLYDTEADRTEQHDLAGADPARAAALAAEWDAWAARASVLPLPAELKRGAAAGSTKTEFTLASGAHLAGEAAPTLAERPFTVTVRFTSPAPAGVLAAQGGSVNGYTLWCAEGRLHFGVRREEAFTEIAVPLAGAMPHVATATLATDGTMRLSLDDAPPVEGRAAGLLPSQPGDGFDAGLDRGAQVGPYTGPSPFQGTIDSVQVKTTAP